jgi:hypothetical protein
VGNTPRESMQQQQQQLSPQNHQQDPHRSSLGGVVCEEPRPAEAMAAQPRQSIMAIEDWNKVPRDLVVGTRPWMVRSSGETGQQSQEGGGGGAGAGGASGENAGEKMTSGEAVLACLFPCFWTGRIYNLTTNLREGVKDPDEVGDNDCCNVPCVVHGACCLCECGGGDEVVGEEGTFPRFHGLTLPRLLKVHGLRRARLRA